MYIKWIVCQVATNEKDNFSTAQEKWVNLLDSKGFIAQFGGWNISKPNEAFILSIWKSKKDLDHFMEYEHDLIYQKIQQKNTYNAISIKFFKRFAALQTSNFDLTKDFIRIKGQRIKLVSTWTVSKNKALIFE